MQRGACPVPPLFNMPLTEYMRDVVLDMILSGNRVYAGLHTDAGELSGGSYSRKPVRYSASREAKKVNGDPIRWTNLPRVREAAPISTVVLYDAERGGNALWPLPMPEPKTANAGDGATIDVGNLINTVY